MSPQSNWNVFAATLYLWHSYIILRKLIFIKRSCASLAFNNTSDIDVAYEISTPEHVIDTFLIISHIKFIKNVKFWKVHENVG